jgi:ankyrin repeat protein
MTVTAPITNKYEFEWAKAIAKDDWRAIEEQIKSGLNVNRGPILHTAIQQKRFSIARKLIENGADINKENKRGKSPLQILIENHRQNPPRKTRRRNFRRDRNHIGSGDTNNESRSNVVLSFGRYMIKEGAKPINGPNEGEGPDYYSRLKV